MGMGNGLDRGPGLREKHKEALAMAKPRVRRGIE
jgi:hypothetical protein